MTIRQVIMSGVARQVMFYDGEGMCAGIMMGDKVVCGCCGGIIDVEDIIENAKIDGVETPIKMFNYWVDFSDEIKGDTNYLAHEVVDLEMEDM